MVSKIRAKSFRVHSPIQAGADSEKMRRELDRGMNLPLARIRDLIKEDGMLRNARDKTVSVRVEPEMAERIKGIARRFDVTESDVMRALIWREELEMDKERSNLRIAARHKNQKKLDEY